MKRYLERLMLPSFVKRLMNRYTAHDISKKDHLKLSDNIFYYVITLTLCIFSHVLLYFHKQSKLLNEVDNHRTPLD